MKPSKIFLGLKQYFLAIASNFSSMQSSKYRWNIVNAKTCDSLKITFVLALKLFFKELNYFAPLFYSNTPQKLLNVILKQYNNSIIRNILEFEILVFLINLFMIQNRPNILSSHQNESLYIGEESRKRKLKGSRTKSRRQ